ncbi:MAG: rhodanese-like domain-containing protein [Thermoanaerobaculia bacterium]|jgi:hypothetical protein
MKNQKRFRAMLAVTAVVALATACSKSEPATSVASQPSAPPTMTTDVPAQPPAGELQPTPGAPVATFTPSTDTAAPMLPVLGSTPIQTPSDEHTQSPAKTGVRRIAPEEAAVLVQSGDAILVDVRSQEAFVADHIRGAKHIPYGEIELRARQELPPTRWIIPYCT